MIELKSKLTKIGNSFYVRIPKPLIDCKVIDREKELVVRIKNIHMPLMFNLVRKLTILSYKFQNRCANF